MAVIFREDFNGNAGSPLSTANGNFSGAGFAPTPASGQLDSDFWRVQGFSDLAGLLDYGAASAASTDYARGVLSGDPTTAGVYSVATGIAALGASSFVIQPTAAEFGTTPGTVTLRVQYTGATTLTGFTFDYDGVFRNNAGRPQNVNFSWAVQSAATQPATFSSTVAALSYATPAALDANGWQRLDLPEQTFTTTINPNDYIYLRWTIGEGAGGSGSRDEVGFDNLVIGTVDAPTGPNIAITPTTLAQNEGNSGSTAYSFTVTRSDTSANTSVDITVGGASGFNASDIASVTVDGVPVAGFNLGTGFQVAFTGATTTATVVVNIAGDTTVEPNENFTVTLTNPTGGYALGTSVATGTVTNDDIGFTAIYTIQGNSTASPLVGQTVTTQGVVTAVDTNGFYIQDATGDADTTTSDGIFVFTSTAPGAGVVVGNLVNVTGTVNEFAGSTPGAATTTQLTAPTVSLVTAGVGVPAAVLVSTDGSGRAPPTTAISPDGIAFWESLEGMRVTLQTPLVVANTNSNGTFGETYVVVSGGVGATGLNDRFGMTIGSADFNPERIQIDDDSGIFAGYTPNHTQGDVLANVTGILNYAFAEYELIVTEAVTTTTDRTLARETSTLAAGPDKLTYANMNVENLDPTDAQSKFDRLASRIVSGLLNPDVIGLQEMQDADGAGSGTNYSAAATAQRLIDAIAAAGGPTYRYVEVAPTANNQTGGEPNGNIRNGYLFNTARVSYVEGSAAWIDTATYSGTRRPLVADFMFNGERFTAINVHSTSRIGSDPLWGATQPPANAGDSARTNQANGVRSFIDAALALDPSRRFVVNGDFNGFQFETALQNLTAGNVMRNLYDLLPAQERYSYIFQGNYQALDHILVSNSLYAGTEFDVVHNNAGYTDGLSAADHDQPLARITQARAGGAGVAMADSFATTEAALYRGTVLANDTGGGTGLVVASVNGIAPGTTQTLASGAQLTLLTDGTFSYNPDGAFAALNGGDTGNDSFSYTLTGGASATVTVTIAGISSAAPTSGDNVITGTPNADTFDLSAGGNDTVSGGANDDAFSFGSAFTALDRVDGGSGANDQVGISGNYAGGAALVLNANTLTNVEVLALLPGAGNSYNITMNDGNVAAGVEMTIFAGNLGAGQNFTFNGSGETDGFFRTFGGLGTDTITGSTQSDGFYFGPDKWQAGDSVVGGLGGNDQLALDGDYTLTIGASADVEVLVLLASPDAANPNDFNITLADAWAGAGQTRTVFGRNLTTAAVINGSAEGDANLTFFGGIAGDTLTGGAGSDTIYGLEGNDAITGGLGSDTAVYQGQRASYSVVTGGGNVQIVDNDAVTDGNDGTDTVVGIEFARFADQTISITSPIILDLDGGGVTTLSAANSNARFDMDGDGVGDDTSWFGRGEGLLFLDRDGNGTLSDAGEMSFTNDVANARSDLEGLAAWDSNGDGQLSAADARFASFKIWRDRDGDGVVDRREIMTLRQAGVRSLSLTGTATSGSYALGDTAIVNTGSFTRTNGRRGGLVDAVLTAVSSKDATARAGQQSGQQSGTAPAIDRGLFTGSFSDAVAQLEPTPTEQRSQPSLTATERDAGDIALAAATPLTVIDDYGNWLKPDSNPGLSLDATLDRRVLLMAQDMASFGATSTSAETDHWRREGSATVEVFAA